MALPKDNRILGNFEFVSSAQMGSAKGYGLESYQGNELIYTVNGKNWTRKSLKTNTVDCITTFNLGEEFHYYDGSTRVTVTVTQEGTRFIHKIKHAHTATLVEDFQEKGMVSIYTIFDRTTVRLYTKK